MGRERVRPIEKMIQESIREDALRFHMPGHKGMPVFPGALQDVTELPNTDELFDPESGIFHAQREAALCWNAASSHLLVNGSTAGIQAMVLWAKVHGYKLLLPRDCHVSAVNACALADIQPEWLLPVWNTDEQINQMDISAACGLVSAETMAILTTYPDYYGRCISLENLKRAAQQTGSVLLTDSAHGSHFVFSDALPEDAGAYSDFWLAGVHKTLPAPTQTAFLHVKQKQNSEEISRLLRCITTTSPSFLLMMGADNSRAYMQENVGRFEDTIGACLALQEQINEIAGLQCWTERDVLAMGYARFDPTRIVVDVHALGITGWQACAKLTEYGVVPEMGDIRRAVLIATVMDDPPRLRKVLEAFRRLAADETGSGKAAPNGLETAPAPGMRAMSIRQAVMSRAEEIPFEESAGRIAAEPFGAYPPGTALCMPGEIISREMIETAKQALSCGGSLYGCRDGKVAVSIE